MEKPIDIPSLQQELKNPATFKDYLRGEKEAKLDARVKRLQATTDLIGKLEKTEQETTTAACKDLLAELRVDADKEADQRISADITALEQRVKENAEKKKTLMEQAGDKTKELGGKTFDQTKEAGKKVLVAFDELDPTQKGLAVGGGVLGLALLPAALRKIWDSINPFKKKLTPEEQKKANDAKPKLGIMDSVKKFVVAPVGAALTTIGVAWLWNKFKGDFGFKGGQGSGISDKLAQKK